MLELRVVVKMIQHIYLIAIVAVLLKSWTPTSSLPHGAPETICDTMLPYHSGIEPSNSVPPFRIEPSAAMIGQGQTLRVDIVGAPEGLNFGGFMIQARNRNPPYQILGQFNPTADGSAKLMNCENSVNNSATHSNASPKPVISLEWQCPVDFLGQIVFNSTVAQTYDTFWVGIPSNPIQVVKREIAPSVIGISSTRPPLTNTVRNYVPEPEKEAAVPKVDDPFYNGCARSKTCFGFPDGCVKTKSCVAVGSVIVRGDIYEFELKGATNEPAYLALGLSTDDKMGDDLVTECIVQNGKVALFTSLTSGKPNYGTTRIGVPQKNAKIVDSSLIDGKIYCKVQRDILTTVQGQMFDLMNNQYYIMVALGKSVKDNGAGYHDIGRIVSGKAIILSDVQDLSGSSNILLRLHGAFMVTAWIGTTSLGILLARYFKQTWVGSHTCGKDQWFAWHRICMVTTWGLTMAGFVIIFVEIGGWSAARNPHAILGVITTVLCFIQPIGAIFRPGPNDRKRPIFNWLHWLGGNLAHIIAIVAIFFAVKLSKAELPEWMDWILVAFVAFHVIVHLIFSVGGCMADRQISQRVNSFPMGDMSGNRNGIKLERKMDAPFASFRKGLLSVYIIMLIFFVVVLDIIVCLAPIDRAYDELKSKLAN
ncbi:putative ferric-chelate reductase 1 homolog isoform X2 [Episyrphus balteatus]|uniref:putative ferric-chelate reductase 1 homolog isoform X2 n=1 Tax=Episyrphus balteatus TaxID=286459 RepID=UPI0024863D71|nr:putative ferric-chelate reductase 1 homolog isoform X2 [Episyrphus balteatus]